MIRSGLAVVGLGQLVGCGSRLEALLFRRGVAAFKRSGRGRCISNAAKKHNANRFYATALAAQNDPPHPGDKSRVVRVFLSADMYLQYFGAGQNMVDMRRL